MPRLSLTALACLAVAVGGVISGCGADKKTPAATPPAKTKTTPAKPSASSAAVVMVSMKQIKFVPENVTAKVGQKIVWTNNDGAIPHTVTATSGATFDSGNVNGGGTFDYTPTKPGTIDYVCTIHSGQTGSITVTK